MVRFQSNKLTVEKVFDNISSQLGYDIFYSEDKLNVTREVEFTKSELEVKEVLETVLDNNFSFQFIEKTIIIIPKSIEKANSSEQKGITVKGVVKDNQGNPLPGVTVMIKGTSIGVATDIEGKFELSIPKFGETLVFSFVGMKNQEVNIAKQKEYIVILESDAQEMEEVVVTGMFQRKASSFTGSAVTLDKEELLKVSNQNLFQSLKSMDPSLMIFDNLEFGSDPNKMPNMQLRGTSTFPGGEDGFDFKGNYRDNPNMPLFVLDGFECSVEKIFDLDMNRVASVTILKDAAAKAMWGSKAANGVVVVETKKDGTGDLRITYSNSFDVSMPDLTSYNLCNAKEKLELEKSAGLYDYDYLQGILDQTYYDRLGVVLSGVDTDWMSKPLRVGLGQKHSIAIEAGDDKLRLNADVAYNKTTGVMKGSERSTISGSINLGYRYKKLRFQNSLSITVNNSADSPYGSFRDYSELNPYWSPVDEDGRIVTNVEMGYSPHKLLHEYRQKDYPFRYNPLYNAQLETKFTNQYTEITNNFSTRYDFFPGLHAKVKLGITKKENSADEFYPANHLKFINYQGEDFFRRGSYQKDEGFSNMLNSDFSLNLSKQIGEKHYVFGFLSYNISERTYEEVRYIAEGFPSDRMNNIIFAKQYLKDTKPTGRESTSREMGFNSSFNYTYDDRFLFDATLRTSASSEFGENQRWGTFWSAGMGWNLHNERVFKGGDVIKRFKLRASLGSTGSQGNDPFASIASYLFIMDKTYTGFLGSYLRGMENKDLKWQKKMDYNIGFDLNINRKLDLRFDYYVSNTENTLIDYTIPPSTGFSSVKMNVGKVENTGIEGYLRWTLYSVPKDRTYMNFSLNAAHNKNKIVEISDALRHYNERQNSISNNSNKPVIKFFDNMSMNAIWAVRSLGIDPATGKEIYLDKDGKQTYIYNAKDQVVCGDEMPDVQGNFSLSLEHKGLALDVTFRYQIGAEMYNHTLVDRIENVDIRNNVDKRLITGRWQKPGDIVPFKALVQYDAFSRSEVEITQPTSRFVQKRDELNLASVRCSYDFYRSDFIKKMKIERFRISAYMNDIFTLSTIKTERGTSYPFARSLNFSIQATF